MNVLITYKKIGLLVSVVQEVPGGGKSSFQSQHSSSPGIKAHMHQGKIVTLCGEHDLVLHSTEELWFAGLGNRRRPSFLTDITPVLSSSWLCRRNVHRREENPIFGSFMLLNLFLSISVLFIFSYKVINFIKIFKCISTELYRFFFSHKK